MTKLLLRVLNMSLTGCVVIAAVLLLRLVLRTAPKRVTCLLWAVVFFRLLCPVSLESGWSLLPSRELLPSALTGQALPAPEPRPGPGLSPAYPVSGPALSGPIYIQQAQTAPGISAQPEPEAPRTAPALDIAARLWLLGCAGLLGWTAVSWLRLRRSVAEAVPAGEGVYACGGLASPFLLGIVRPRIYIPEGLKGEALDHVLAHERIHLRRGDCLWKLLAWLAVVLHWFNPLVWLSFHLLGRDMEEACDEQAVRAMTLEQRKAYSRALLELAAPRYFAAGCPVAFGEVSVGERIRRVLSCRRPALWLAAAAVAAVALTAVCLGLDPKAPEDGGGNAGEDYAQFKDFAEQTAWLSGGATGISSTIYRMDIYDPELLHQARELLLAGTVPGEGREHTGAAERDLSWISLRLQGGSYYLRELEDGCYLYRNTGLGRTVSASAVLPAGTLRRLHELAERQRELDAAYDAENGFDARYEQEHRAFLERMSAVTAAQVGESLTMEQYDPDQNLDCFVLLARMPERDQAVYGRVEQGRCYQTALLLRTAERVEVLADGIGWPVTVNAGIAPGLYAGDYDGDGRQELALVMLDAWGADQRRTYGLYIIEENGDGTHALHALEGEACAALTAENLSLETDLNSRSFQVREGEEVLLTGRLAPATPGESFQLNADDWISFQAAGDGITLTTRVGAMRLPTETVPWEEYYPDAALSAPVLWDGARFTRGSYTRQSAGFGAVRMP